MGKSEAQKFRISGNFWNSEPGTADDVLSHLLKMLPEDTEVVEAFAQQVSKTVVYAAMVVVLEDESVAKEVGEKLNTSPCPWHHDGTQVVPLW